MKKIIAAVGLSIVLFTSASSAASVSPTLTPENFGPVKVQIADDATGGCWTNLGEVQTYAEDKLRLLGYEIVDESPGQFAIHVNGSPITDAGGNCYGNIRIEMYRVGYIDELIGSLRVASEGTTFLNYANANNLALDQVAKMIDAMHDEMNK